jgi:hypothetical protein
MDFEVVRVNRDGRVFERDYDFDRVILLTSVEREQRVFIEPQLSEDAFELWSGFGQSSLRTSLFSSSLGLCAGTARTRVAVVVDAAA